MPDVGGLGRRDALGLWGRKPWLVAGEEWEAPMGAQERRDEGWTGTPI